ncbi:ankyrin repeat domain-containing protein [Candidatus Phycorickettsia trachydisci]|nr:ankyrin repeat domain-containing protein [Candidatus Phycorickettsia trachydisci]
MTSTINKLFNYVLEMRKYGEEADNHPELESELKIKWEQIIDELKSKKQEHSEAVEKEILQLKAAGQDINPYDQNQNFSLLHFVIGGFLDTKLLQHFTITDIKDPNDFLAIAIYNDNIEAVQWLLDNGVSPNAQDEDGDTMLQLAVWNDESGEIVKLLIDRGADINAQNAYGHTALQAALPAHDIAIIEFLLEKGADVNIKDKYDSSALDKIFIRCYEYGKEIIIPDDIRLKFLKLLIDHGAQVTPKEISQTMWYDFQYESTKSQALLLMLGSAKEIKIDMESYSVRQFFTDENNIKALFAADGYEEHKAIAKANLLKNLQDYSQNHHDQKVLDITQLVEQEIDLSTTEIAENNELPDQLYYKVELSGDTAIDTIDAA